VHRLIALDVDGTLLDSAHRLTPRVRAAVRAARARGIHVSLATGKLLRSAADLVEALALEGPQITNNGATIMPARGGVPIHFWPLEPEALAATLAAIRAADPTLGIAWYTPDDILTDAPPGPLDDVLAAYHEPPLRRVAQLGADLPAPAKLLVTGAPERLAALRAAVSPALLDTTRIITTTPDFLEFFSLRVSKGIALETVTARLGLRREEVVAIGDGENDIALLQAAGTAVAMGNAVPALRAHANAVTASNDEDGVALAIETLLAGGTLPGVAP
jgi:Cof subfamily protein (haloacid dehalogenase superfamily)